MSVVVAHDAIHANIGHLPPGQCAGYTTGSIDIRWTSADWHAHPGAVRICQDSTASDATADVLDVETGAATNGEAAAWYLDAAAAYRRADRPGQREPAIYTSASNVTPLVNALIAGGVKSGPKLWVANWNDAVAADQKAVQDASGPFPIIGFQFINGQFYDSNVFSQTWLAAVSAAGPTWQQWDSDGKTSLGALAGSLGLWPSHILAHTAQAGHGIYDNVTANYVSAVFDGTLTAGDPIPVGATLWIRK